MLRDSPESPLYPGNLTQQRVKRMIRFSEARAAYLESVSAPNATIAPDRIMMSLLGDAFLYIVKVGIGTPPVQGRDGSISVVLWCLQAWEDGQGSWRILTVRILAFILFVSVTKTSSNVSIENVFRAAIMRVVVSLTLLLKGHLDSCTIEVFR